MKRPSAGKGEGLDLFAHGARAGLSNAGSAENQFLGGGSAIAPLDQFVLDLLTFLQGFLARALDGRDMDENVLAAIRRRNETITFRGVKPLHNSASHWS